VIAVGDPTVIDFEVLPNPRMIRVLGKRAGVTDLFITTDDDEVYSFEIHVGYDLALLSLHLRQLFPDARLKLTQIREHLAVEGQARSAAQVAEILEMLEGFLASVLVPSSTRGTQSAQPTGAPPSGQNGEEGSAPLAVEQPGGKPNTQATIATPRVINLIHVPGVQQVMLKVRIAELNRTGLRQIGADLFINEAPGAVLGTQIGGAVAGGRDMMGNLLGLGLGSTTTAFGIFDGGDFQIFFQALRRNNLVNILAEPNLVAMSGHEASFLAGGQFPVPVPQGSSGGVNNVTVQFKDFGVQLAFLPFVLDDDAIRLTVTPEVSSIDFALGTTLVVGGDRVPGLNTRRATTTVEIQEGQTLAIAGLLQVELEAGTSRIPGLGDLPYIGPLFSNTSHERKEKELLVFVTPYLVSPIHDAPCIPGDQIRDPTDLEFYFHNRIEGHTDRPFRAPISHDHACRHLFDLEQQNVFGPVGFSNIMSE
jgi:pilus assembly protein CpaC